MPATPNVPYDPVQSVKPSGAPQGDYLQVRSNPADFGAQVGQATQELGKSVAEPSAALTDIALKYQGMINEAAATNGETAANAQYGSIMGAYKEKQGPEALASYNDTITKLQQVRQNLRKTMPNDMAAKSFDLLVGRAEGYVLRDANTYFASQVRATDVKSSTDSLNTSVNDAGSPEVAFDDQRFQDKIHNIYFQGAKLLQAQGYGEGINQDMTTGEISFPDTDVGNKAKAVAQNFFNEALSKAWTNRIDTVAFDPQNGNVEKAVDLLEANKDRIPATAYREIASRLSGAYKNAKSREDVDGTWSQLLSDYNNQHNQIQTQELPDISAKPSVSDLLPAFKAQEGGGLMNVMQIQPGTWKQWAQPGENINNPEDNQRVAERMLDQYMLDYHGDTARTAVAYFSGPGNVAPEGSANPWKFNTVDRNGKSVASYVDDILRRTQTQSVIPSAPPVVMSKVDFLRQNSDKYIEEARNKTIQRFPDHPELADQSAQRMESYINSQIRQQEQSDRVHLNNIFSYVENADKQGQPITSIYQLENGPPDIQQAWREMEANYPYQSTTLMNRIALANSKGKADTYGTNFWNDYSDIASGRIKSELDLGGDLDGRNLTNTGFEELRKLIANTQTPQGKADATALVSFFNQMHNLIVAPNSGLYGAVKDTIGEQKFTEFMQQALPEIEAKRNQGVSVSDLTNPQSKDFVGHSLQNYIRDPAKMLSDQQRQFKAAIESGSILKFDPTTLKTIKDSKTGIDTLNQAFKSGQITAQQATQFAIQYGWTNSQKPPEVPTEGLTNNQPISNPEQNIQVTH